MSKKQRVFLFLLFIFSTHFYLFILNLISQTVDVVAQTLVVRISRLRDPEFRRR